MLLTLFRGVERGDTKQGFTGESFKQGLIFGRFHDRNKVVREVINNSHELGYLGASGRMNIATRSSGRVLTAADLRCYLIDDGPNTKFFEGDCL